MTDEFLNVRDAAKRLGVHENTVRNWCDAGILSAHRLPSGGRFRRIPTEQVEALRLARQNAEVQTVTHCAEIERLSGEVVRSLSLHIEITPERAIELAKLIHYVSTYCIHDNHGKCRLTCKTCDKPCQCPCHATD